MPVEEQFTKYKDVGIDIKKIKKIQNQIGKDIEKTQHFIGYGKVISGFGHYAGLIEIGNKIMALHTDGVGTKILDITTNGKIRHNRYRLYSHER